jgi:hypothetical protein
MSLWTMGCMRVTIASWGLEGTIKRRLVVAPFRVHAILSLAGGLQSRFLLDKAAGAERMLQVGATTKVERMSK